MSAKYLIKSKIPVLWDLSKIQFNWIEDYCVGQTSTDKWNIPANDTALLDLMYTKWNINANCTKHYISFDTILNFDANDIFQLIPGKNHLCTFLKLTPGYCIPWHIDTYRYYVKTFNLTKDQCGSVNRTLVMLNDWRIGQVLQYGKDVLSQWSAGDTISWNHNLWHGGANFGNKDLIVLMVTYQQL